MALPLLPLIGGVVDLARLWVSGRVEKSKAKIEADVAIQKKRTEIAMTTATLEGQWDLEQAQASENSWKDEWLTLLVSIPLILAFISDDGREAVRQGFDALATMPDWYRWAVGIVFAASFGVKKAVTLIGKWNGR